MVSTRRFVLASIALTCAALPAATQTQLWAEKFGTTTSDGANTSAPDGSGGVFVGGYTYGSLAAPINGSVDATLARYDGAGNQLWLRQFGSSGGEIPSACVSDGAGGVYLGGTTSGSIAGPGSVGGAWLARFDGAGNQLWIRQFTTSAVHGWGGGEELSDAAPDGAGGVFVAGSTDGNFGGTHFGKWDAWVAHYDSAGNQTWVQQFGTSATDHLRAVAPDGSGGFYLGGSTGGDFGGTNAGAWDAWLARYDGTGSQLWIRQLGTVENDDVWAAAEGGSGGVYCGGKTGGDLVQPGFGLDAWLARYDGAGNQLWIRQIGSSNAQPDELDVAAPGGFGGVIVGGSTLGDLGGPTPPIGISIWLARYDASGAQEWITNIDSPGSDWARAAASDGAAGVFVCGSTSGSLAGPPNGLDDGFVVRMGPTCNSDATVYCTAKQNSLGCVPAIAMLSALSASSGSAGTVVASNVVGSMFGIFFHSTSGANAMPFHGGFLCVSPPLLRHGLLNSGGTAGTCTGSFSEQFNAYIAGGADPALVAGAQVWIQSWSRDPAAPFADSLSDAVTATICP
jgi:hypothetical protein